MKDKVLQLSRSLLNLHRHFLANERYEAEKKLERSLSPFDFLHLLTQDPAFTWLQPFSALIAEVDTFLDETENITPQDLIEMRDQVKFVFESSNPRLKERIQHYLTYDTEFMLLNSRVVKSLNDLLPMENRNKNKNASDEEA